MKVLVLDAHSTAALAVVRSLGRRGIPVDVAGEEADFLLAFRSRHAGRKLLYPGASADLRAFLEFFRGLLGAGGYDYVLPVTDRSIVPLHERGRDLPGAERLVLPEKSRLEAVLDKEKTLRLAREEGVPVPATSVWGEAGFALPAEFPLVVKSRFSRHLEGERLAADPGVVFVRGREDLEKVCREREALIPRPLVQETIVGEGYGFFVLAREGEPLLAFAHRRLREEDPRGSRSSCCESVVPDPEMENSALKLIRRLGWTGVAMVEFKRDRRDGIFKLMEVNGRFWGSLPLALAAGADFPYALLRMLEGKPVPGYAPRPGVRARYLRADLERLISVFRGAPPGWTGPFPGRLETLGAVLVDFARPGTSGFTLTLDDPRPGLAELARFLFRDLPRRLIHM